MDKKKLRLEDLEVYSIALDIAEEIYLIVTSWKYLDIDTVGKQLIRSADSIAANISEGFGRFHFKENKLFCYYARGSMYETTTWLYKAHTRNLISEDSYQILHAKMKSFSVKLNNYITSIGSNTDSPLPYDKA